MKIAMEVRHLFEPIEEVVPCRSPIQKWAAEHAFKLIWIAISGIIGWLMLLTDILLRGHL